MEEALVTLLLGNAALALLIGARAFWVQRPQGSATPALVLTRISGVRQYTMTGPEGLVESRVQIDCYGPTYAAAKGLARAVEQLLSGYGGIVSNVWFQGIFFDSETDNFEDTAAPDKLFRIITDYMIWHKGV